VSGATFLSFACILTPASTEFADVSGHDDGTALAAEG
jgi:hypothetical protein